MPRSWKKREREAPDDVPAQVRRAYALAFNRQPAEDEVAFARRFIDERGRDQFCIVIFNSSEFMYVD